MKFLFRTEGGLGALIARLALAAAIFPHGAQKVLGWWGGSGYEATLQFLTSQAGPELSNVVAMLVIFGEFLGPIALLFGFLTRFAALGLAIIMAGAAEMHYPQFFMNWEQQPGQGEGFEYHILAVGLALLLTIQGAGWLSIDRKLGRSSRSDEA